MKIPFHIPVHCQALKFGGFYICVDFGCQFEIAFGIRYDTSSCLTIFCLFEHTVYLPRYSPTTPVAVQTLAISHDSAFLLCIVIYIYSMNQDSCLTIDLTNIYAECSVGFALGSMLSH